MYISKWQPHARAFDPTQIKQAGESPPNRVSLDLGRAAQPVLGACLHKYEHGAVAGAGAKLIYLKQMARTCVVQQPPGNRKRQKETENNGIYI